MTTVNVEFLHNAGEDCAGERKAIAAKRALHLERQGYVRILDTEAAVTGARENAAAPASTRSSRMGRGR